MPLSEDQADTVVLGDWLALRRLELHSSLEPAIIYGSSSEWGLRSQGAVGFEGV